MINNNDTNMIKSEIILNIHFNLYELLNLYFLKYLVLPIQNPLRECYLNKHKCYDKQSHLD